MCRVNRGHHGERSVLRCDSAVLIEIPEEIPESTTHGGSLEFCLCGCDRGACIPQREYERQRTDPLSQEELQELIPFSVNGVCGYPLVDALKKQYTGLDGKDDEMFIGFKSSISLRLEVRPLAPV